MKDNLKEYIYDQEIDINNEAMSVDLKDKKVANTPKVLGIISFVISLVAIPYTYVMSSISIAMSRAYNSKEIFNLLKRKSPYVTAPILISILFGILIALIGLGAFILGLISLRYLKVSYIGFFVCSILYFFLIFPSYGASIFQFVLCLIAGYISYKNYKNQIKFKSRVEYE